MIVAIQGVGVVADGLDKTDWKDVDHHDGRHEIGVSSIAIIGIMSISEDRVFIILLIVPIFIMSTEHVDRNGGDSRLHIRASYIIEIHRPPFRAFIYSPFQINCAGRS